MSARNLTADGPETERTNAHLMATAIESWLNQIPKWRQMPEITDDETNIIRAIAATQIAKAAGRLMSSASSVLDANINGVLGYQARTAYELYIDAAWLRIHDENGILSEQFVTWPTVAMDKQLEMNGRPAYGSEILREARERFGDRLNNPDEWTAIEGERKVTNSNNRRKAVAAKLEKAGAVGFSDVARRTFKLLNCLSHGVTATTIGGKAALAISIITGCYLTIQECQGWLLEMTRRFPDSEAQYIAKQLEDLSANYLESTP